MNVHVRNLPTVTELDDLHLTTGDAFLFMEKHWVVQSRCSRPIGYIVVDASAPGVEHPMASSDIKLWHREGQLEFVMQSEFGLPVGVRESLRRTLRAFKKAERQEIFRRLRYCQTIDSIGGNFPRSERLQPFIDAVAGERNDDDRPDWRSVYRWWKIWARAGRDPRALCPSRRRQGNFIRRFAQYQLDAMNKAIDQHYLRRHRPTFATAYRACCNYITEHVGGSETARRIVEEQAALPAEQRRSIFPSEKAFREECRRRSRAERLLGRMGPQATRNALFPVGEGPDVRLPMERVEADFKFLRLFVVDEVTGFPLGTPYLMAAIDCYSTCIVGFDVSFDPPSYVSVGRCLRHVVSFKDTDSLRDPGSGGALIRHSYPINGVPRQLVLDNEAVFHSEALRESARQIGTHIHFVPKGHPWEKGHIERLWLTVDQCFLDMFPGKVIRPANKPGHDYDPSDDAVITLSMLKAVLMKAIVDVYHQADHPSIDGKSRIQVWNDAVRINPPRPVRRHEDLIELVGRYEKRKAERRGIRFKGLRYNSYELAKYRSGFEKDPWVEIRIDPDDIGSVWVVDSGRGTSFRIPCTRAEYAEGLSLHQHLVIQRRAKGNTKERYIRMQHLLIAKAELFALAEAMLKQKSVRGARKRVAQFLGAGREFIDLLARRHDDPAESEKFLDLAPEREADDRIFDPEDDHRAEQELWQFEAAEEAARVGSNGTRDRANAPRSQAAKRPQLPAPPSAERPRTMPASEPEDTAKSDVRETSEPRRPRRDTGTLRISIDD